MNRVRRQLLMVDPKVQGALLTRVVYYWMIGVAVIGLLIGFQVMIESQTAPLSAAFGRVLAQYGPALIASLILLPVILFDCLRVTNKFAGPLLRLRREIRNLAEAAPTSPLKFRKNDLYDELADDFNRLADRVRSLEAATQTKAKPIAGTVAAGPDDEFDAGFDADARGKQAATAR